MATPDPLLDPGFKYSINTFPGNGAKTTWDLSFTGGYISKQHIKAYEVSPGGEVTERTFTWVGDYQISVIPAVVTGSTLVVYRNTPKDQPLVDFNDGAIINEPNLDKLARQAVFAAAEMIDRFADVSAQAGEADEAASEALTKATQAFADAATALAKAETAEETAQSVEARFLALLANVQDLTGVDLGGLARLNLPQTFEAKQTFLALAVADTTGTVEFFGDGTFRKRGPGGGAWGATLALNSWAAIQGKPDTFPPAAHAHTWASITGKPTTFAPEPHDHMWDSISGKPLTFAPAPHQHPWSDITGRPNVAINGQAASFLTLTVGGQRVPTITVSTSAPTGGVDGDLWFIVT